LSQKKTQQSYDAVKQTFNKTSKETKASRYTDINTVAKIPQRIQKHQ